MIQLSDYFGKFEDSLELTPSLRKNAVKIISLTSELLSRFDPNFKITITSGFRPVSYNKQIGGSANSKHCFCQAIDIWDPDKLLGKWCLLNLETLKELGLYMESLTTTHAGDDPKKYWIHLQSVPPKSAHLVFIP